MSWAKKPGGPPGDQAAFNPQQFNNQQNMYPGYAGAPAQQWPQQQQQQIPPQQPQQQQYKQYPFQPEYPNANQMYQQPYNQNYPGYQPQPGYQYYPNQPNQPPQGHTDAWEDNWDWGWDESAKQAQLAAQNQPQAFNNANVIEESFASTDTWNWSMEDKKEEKPAESQELKPEPPKEDVKLSDKEVVKERLPNLALGKRLNSDLTPQWSIESQMSQESSDPLHSESTYRSENQSRNSTKSSPGHNDTTNFNFHGEELMPPIDWPTPTVEEVERRDRKSDELACSLQEMSITNDETQERHEAPSPSRSPAAIPPPPVSNLPLPPTNFPASSQNPFKNTGSFSHKSTPSKSTTPSQPFPGMTALNSPAAVNKVQHRTPVGFGANLETTPDNSERPDQPQVAFRPLQVPQVPDNLEVAPQNDRNEYLQTAHLSTGDYENTDFSRGLPPPPGLRRMVVGQQESNSDEPPPGLSRMVPGQQTEADNSYNQPDNYMDRHIDGQPTDENPRPYRQADGQQTPDYSQPQRTRPIGRMVPGEPSNDEYPQYQAGYNEHRVVTGVDHDYPNAGPSDIREQNVDGSDYTEPPRNPFNVRGSSNDVSSDYNGPPEEQQREVMMEGENLQDLSAVASSDLTYTREHFDGADTNATDPGSDRKTDLSENDHQVSSSRRQSINRTSGDDSERDRIKSSPRRDRKLKSSRDKDRDDGRYSRDRKYDRDGRPVRRERDDKDRRERRDGREREASPEGRKHRRGTRSRRYETEDTDYYSDRERERRRYREGSYSSKPPRPDDYRRYDDRHRYNTIERDRRYDDDERRRYGRYRDIDPNRKYGSLRRDEDRRVVTFSGDVKDPDIKGDPYSSPSRAESRDAGPTDDELNETLASTDSRRRSDKDRDRDRHRRRHRTDAYYDGYGSVYQDPYALQRQQYQYYEHLRLTNPTRYMEIYKQIMAGQPPPPPPPEYLAAASKINAMQGYGPLGYDNRGVEGGSVHSGRSSANGLKGTDTYYGRYDASLRDAPSLRTDLSDRELNTDASLNLHLEDSTVRSERMTPFKFSTAHVKGNISSRHIVVVRPSYPVDGLPATVQIVSLSASLASDPSVRELVQYPGPLVKGVTHKKSVIEYCASRVRNAGGRGDVVGYVLLWQLLALLLKQNGVVVGIDIAELLMKNKRDYEFNTNAKTTQQADGRGSSVSEEDSKAAPATDQTPPEEPNIARQSGIDEKAALDQLREYLTYGNRQEAIEWAMSHNLWGHAFQLCAHADRRTRAAVAARFVAGVPRNDPLHTLYHTLAGRQPPDSEWGDWRAHAAIILSNTSAKPENETRTLTQLGDTLISRGHLYSAQFCYISARVPFSRHPLAPFAPPPSVPTSPPRLALLLADSRADSLNQLATNEAIFATEIYEYALSLSQDYCIGELQAYKFLLACRLVDAGEYERALAYTEALARAVTRTPRDYPQQLVAQLYQLADRLKYHDPALNEDPPLLEEGEQSEPSPRHQQWLDDVAGVAQVLEAEAEASKQATPVHQPPPVEMYVPTQYTWEQTQQAQPPELYNAQPLQSAYPEPYQPEPYRPEEPYYPRQQPAEYADPEYWPQEQYQYEPPRVSTRRAPTARVPPRTLHTLPSFDESLEMIEYHRSPGLRKRIHPKNKTVNVGFEAGTSPGRMRTISRGSTDSSESKKKPLSDLDIQIAHSPQLGVSANEPTKSQMFEANRRGRYGKVISNTVDTWARQTVHIRDGTYKPLIFGGTYPIEVPASPPEEKEKPVKKTVPVAEVKATMDQATHRRELKKTIERSLDRFEAILAKRDPASKRQAFSKRVVNTFDIDEPVNVGETRDVLKDKDARYYVSGPKTFNIDEPVAFIFENDPKQYLPGEIEIIHLALYTNKTRTLSAVRRLRCVFCACVAQAPADAGAAAGPGADEADEPRPQITMPGAAASRPAMYADYEDDRPPSADTDRDTDTPKPAKKSDSKKQEPQKKSGWLGGIFTKLTLRSPNQMILPDDKNPSIVWDAVNKRWQNLDADGEETASAPPPPPKTADIPAMHASSPLQAPPAAGLPPVAPVSNIFKMQKGRHIKKSYVDVFNPSGAPTRPLPPASEVLGPGPALGAPPQYMLPQQTFDPSQSQPDDTYNSGY
ncbi:uncharacterized protein LOC134660708 [Cydia amplana]|uniref:uncharacterized protein LOC134660708 n=1 Tax=Cydia amplana TaxID=1869771 RepID=UPI002FE59714